MEYNFDAASVKTLVWKLGVPQCWHSCLIFYIA